MLIKLSAKQSYIKVSSKKTGKVSGKMDNASSVFHWSISREKLKMEFFSTASQLLMGEVCRFTKIQDFQFV